MARVRTGGEEAGVNLTPMIDVVFLLVVFFMVGAHFGQPSATIDVNVPAVGDLQALARQPDQRHVDVSSDGQLRLDGQTVSLDQLDHQLRRAHHQYPQLRVAVRGDGQAAFQRVAEVLATIRRSGIQQIGVAASGQHR